MGWKSLKEHFQIEHIVQMGKDCLFIGSGYCHNLVTIDLETGDLHPNRTFPNFLKENYPNLLEAKAAEIKDLINAQDHFDKSIIVYTYDGGEIIEKYCENPVWPNITHDGMLIYENTFSTDKEKIISRAKRNLEAALENTLNRIQEAEKDLAMQNRYLEDHRNEIEKLKTSYPYIYVTE